MIFFHSRRSMLLKSSSIWCTRNPIFVSMIRTRRSGLIYTQVFVMICECCGCRMIGCCPSEIVVVAFIFAGTIFRVTVVVAVLNLTICWVRKGRVGQGFATCCAVSCKWRLCHRMAMTKFGIEIWGRIECQEYLDGCWKDDLQRRPGLVELRLLFILGSHWSLINLEFWAILEWKIPLFTTALL